MSTMCHVSDSYQDRKHKPSIHAHTYHPVRVHLHVSASTESQHLRSLTHYLPDVETSRPYVHMIQQPMHNTCLTHDTLRTVPNIYFTSGHECPQVIANVQQPQHMMPT
ncbi:hypothetical protein Pfo_014031 [Paulownia fortunei]|nr:hypothetical protein Pfo_014031 [Paulownia fortunei]